MKSLNKRGFNLPCNSINSLLLIIFVILNQSCKQFVEVPQPVDQLTSILVFADDNSAIKTITGIYIEMMVDQQQFSAGSTTLFGGMSADELYYYMPSYRDEFTNNEITLANHSNIDYFFWQPCYKHIYSANKCIEGAENSTSLSPEVKNSIIGEAKFIRAFCYFYLVNFFGNVPLVLTTAYQQNLSSAAVADTIIYNQIIADLTDAKEILTTDYPTPERVRPNKFAAAALLARVYLYTKNWAAAENESTAVINGNMYALDTGLNDVFQINSGETIWQLHPVTPYYNTWEGYLIIPPDGFSPAYLVTAGLLNSFEPSDERKKNWLMNIIFNGDTLYYPYKYKINTGSTLQEYYVVLRLAEQFLIRAEARARQHNLQAALKDLNIIRRRAGLPDVETSDQQQLLTAVEHERRIELFCEWGHRWFDLKRTGRADAVLGILKPSTWQPTDTLWPIPDQEIKLNPALKQNAGY